MLRLSSAVATPPPSSCWVWSSAIGTLLGVRSTPDCDELPAPQKARQQRGPRRRRQFGYLGGREGERHGPLGGPGDLVGVDETPHPVLGLDHQTVPDVLAVVVERLDHLADDDLLHGVYRHSPRQLRMVDRVAVVYGAHALRMSGRLRRAAVDRRTNGE